MALVTAQTKSELGSVTTTGAVYVAVKKANNEPGYYNHADGSSNIKRKELPIEVENVRRLSKPPMLDLEGYQLVNFRTTLPERHFLESNLSENDTIIQDVYFNECRRIALQVTGAAEAYPYVYRVRNQERSREHMGRFDFHKDSVPIVHVDRDTWTAPQRLRASLGAEKADMLLAKYKRYGSMNVWRPIKNVVQKWPLMLVNHQSIPDWDYDTHMIKLHSSNDGRIATRGAKNHETILTFDARYRYMYAPDMSPDEAWLFYAFHSNPALAIPHSAFWDDSSAPDAPTRWSIEVRVWVFFE
jgi:hypothetical protein